MATMVVVYGYQQPASEQVKKASRKQEPRSEVPQTSRRSMAVPGRLIPEVPAAQSAALNLPLGQYILPLSRSPAVEILEVAMRKAVSALGAVGLVLTMYAFPPLQDYLFALQGYGVVCREPEEQVVLPSEEGSSAFARYQIANITSSAIQVAGLTSSCPCVSPVNLPLDIPPHEKCDLIIKVNGGCKAGETNRYYATLLLSQRGHPIQVILLVNCVDLGTGERGRIPVAIPDPLFQ